MSGKSSIMRNQRKNSLPTKHYKQKWIGRFCGGFLGRERREKLFSEFLGLFSRIFSLFLPIFLFSLIFSIKSPYVCKKRGGIYRVMREMGVQRRCNMLHLSQPTIFATSSILFCLFLVSSPIFVQLFGHLSQLRFLKLYIHGKFQMSSFQWS